MVLVAIFIVILICPLFITSYIFVDTKLKKLFFAFYLFDAIKLKDGFITRRNLGGFYVHLKNKAIIIDNSNFSSIRADTNIFNAFLIVSLESRINVRCETFNQCYLVLVVNFLKNLLLKTIVKNYFLSNPKIDVNLYFGDFEFQSKIRFKIVFNLICITYLIITNYINKGVKNVKTSQQY